MSPLAFTRVRPHLHFSSDTPAHLDRTPCLERAIFSLPDISRSDLGLEVHAIELFEDVLDFVRDELYGVRRRREEDMCRDEHTVLADGSYPFPVHPIPTLRETSVPLGS
jgi:hypothetical protein